MREEKQIFLLLFHHPCHSNRIINFRIFHFSCLLISWLCCCYFILMLLQNTFTSIHVWQPQKMTYFRKLFQKNKRKSETYGNLCQSKKKSKRHTDVINSKALWKGDQFSKSNYNQKSFNNLWSIVVVCVIIFHCIEWSNDSNTHDVCCAIVLYWILSSRHCLLSSFVQFKEEYHRKRIYVIRCFFAFFSILCHFFPSCVILHTGLYYYECEHMCNYTSMDIT